MVTVVKSFESLLLIKQGDDRCSRPDKAIAKKLFHQISRPDTRQTVDKLHTGPQAMKLYILVDMHDTVCWILLTEVIPDGVWIQTSLYFAQHELKDGQTTAEAFSSQKFTFMYKVYLLKNTLI